MSRSPRKDFSFDLFLQEIFPYETKLQPLVERLEALYEERRNLMANKTKIDFITNKAGQEIYDQALDGICESLLYLKQNFPQRVAGCALFENVESPDYQKKFRDNFYKFFIDRNRLDRKEVTPFFFNRDSKRSNRVGSSLIYAEGFAVAFLAMLVCLKKNFQEQRNIDEEEFLSLLRGLGGLAAGREVLVRNDDDGLPSKSHRILYSSIKPRKIHMQKFGGNTTLTYPDGLVKNIFAKNFNHIECASQFWQNFQEKIAAAKERVEVQKAIYDLMDFATCNTHVLRDGNSRALLLVGTFLSIFYGVEVPLSIDRLCYHSDLFEEAVKWSKEFLLNPAVPAIDPESIALLEAVQSAICAEFSKEIASNFLIDLFNEEGTKDVATPYNQTMDLVLRENGGELHILPLREANRDSINCRCLYQVIEDNKTELLAENDMNLRNAKVAFLLLQKFISLPNLTEGEKRLGKKVVSACDDFRYESAEGIDELVEKYEEKFSSNLESESSEPESSESEPKIPGAVGTSPSSPRVVRRDIASSLSQPNP